MNLSPDSSLDELRRRHEAALASSARAVARHREAYGRLRRDAAQVAFGTLDIGAYHETAARMVGCLELLCRPEAGTLFVFYRRALDPRAEGHVRTFRPLCCDLLATLAELDRWRRDRGRLRRIK
jgi:hypothetical protein